MSRHYLSSKEDGQTLVVGWDPGFGSFFLQYGDPSSDLPLDLSTGQHLGEHPTPDAIVALAEHLGENTPPQLSSMLENDRRTEGQFQVTESPGLIIFRTRGRKGEDLGFHVSRTRLAIPGVAEAIADHILSGEAERSMPSQSPP